MENIIFIANNNLGQGQSGGDTIFLQLIKHWQNKLLIHIFACKETENLIKDQKIEDIDLILTSHAAYSKNYFSIFNLFTHIFKRTFLGLASVFKNIGTIKRSSYVYSVSDFYPDFFPALLVKILNPKIKLIVGYYLLVPFPLFSDSPYKGKLIFKGFLYWLMQLPTKLLTNLFADIVYITSSPDIKYFPHKKIVIVQGGVDLKNIQKHLVSNKKMKKYDAVFIGRLHPQKGVIELVDIWKKVVSKMSQSKLAIIGDGELEPILKNKIKNLGLNKNITLLGFQNGKKKYDTFNMSKIVVHPAIFDSGGMAAAEAMAFGLPGVSYDLDALKTYYPQGFLKAKCFNQDDFSEKIIKLLSDKNLYRNLSTSAKKLINSYWNWEYRSDLIFQQTFN